MVGTWLDEGENATIVTQCSWTKNRKFLKRSFQLKVNGQVTLHGDQIVGFDPLANQTRSWTFDSEGGIGEGVWIQDGNRWLVKSWFVLADGSRASSLNVYTYVDDDTFRWQSTNCEIAGELQPSIPEVTVVRSSDDGKTAPASYLEPNDIGRNSYNNFTAKPNDDASFTIHFGGDRRASTICQSARGGATSCPFTSHVKKFRTAAGPFRRPNQRNSPKIGDREIVGITMKATTEFIIKIKESMIMNTTRILFFPMLIGLVLFAVPAWAQDVLPFPDPPMGGKVGPTMQESVHKWREAQSHLPEDAPNILIVMLDDVGFAQASTFGGEINTPTLSRLANEGIAYNRFQAGKLIDELEARGIRDNTIVIYIVGDNGAAAEGIEGTVAELMAQNGIPSTVDEHIAVVEQLGGLEEIGGPKMDNMYNAAWAWAGDSPFRYTKLVAADWGGTRTPMVISWPAD